MNEETPAGNGSAATTAHASAAPAKRGLLRTIVWVLVAALVLYLASPYLAFYRFTKAVRAKDHRRIERYVDFRSVRQSLKQQLRAKIPKSAPAAAAGQPAPGGQDRFAGLVERLAPALIDQLVDAFVTPEGLTALIADPGVARQAKDKDPGVVARVGSDATKELAHEFGWDDVRWAFFTGPRDFLIDVNGTKLRYRFSKFRWTLKTVELPLDEDTV